MCTRGVSRGPPGVPGGPRAPPATLGGRGGGVPPWHPTPGIPPMHSLSAPADVTRPGGYPPDPPGFQTPGPGGAPPRTPQAGLLTSACGPSSGRTGGRPPDPLVAGAHRPAAGPPVHLPGTQLCRPPGQIPHQVGGARPPPWAYSTAGLARWSRATSGARRREANPRINARTVGEGLGCQGSAWGASAARPTPSGSPSVSLPGGVDYCIVDQ